MKNTYIHKSEHTFNYYHSNAIPLGKPREMDEKKRAIARKSCGKVEPNNEPNVKSKKHEREKNRVKINLYCARDNYSFQYDTIFISTFLFIVAMAVVNCILLSLSCQRSPSDFHIITM